MNNSIPERFIFQCALFKNLEREVFMTHGYVDSHIIDQSLLLDDVANKAGYTKWYFQRLFKKVTGVTLASYIRARRLTKAAVELRLTKKTILEIALKYQFDSQQSFTRRFKYIFKVTPSYYRRNKLWELEAMH
ncbi:helix-turn-helix domain-containing protein [Escherichia coli]|nr:helix-turn-helix domain-containing protein [Escherichia coli]NZC50379.1 helix-turn-helix domain-containing protein [Escherichia coli]